MRQFLYFSQLVCTEDHSVGLPFRGCHEFNCKNFRAGRSRNSNWRQRPGCARRHLWSWPLGARLHGNLRLGYERRLLLTNRVHRVWMTAKPAALHRPNSCSGTEARLASGRLASVAKGARCFFGPSTNGVCRRRREQTFLPFDLPRWSNIDSMKWIPLCKHKGFPRPSLARAIWPAHWRLY